VAAEMTVTSLSSSGSTSLMRPSPSASPVSELDEGRGRGGDLVHLEEVALDVVEADAQLVLAGDLKRGARHVLERAVQEAGHRHGEHAEDRGDDHDLGRGHPALASRQKSGRGPVHGATVKVQVAFTS
jgi:hypothetical protein